MIDFMAESAGALDAQFGELVKEMRQAREWSQSDLAERMVKSGAPDSTQVTVSRIEAGKRAVRLAEAQAIALVFQVSLANLADQSPELGRLDFRHRSARSQYVQFREATARLVEAQLRLEQDWLALEKYLDSTDIPAARRAELELLARNMDLFTKIDPGEEAAAIQLELLRTWTGREESSAGRFLNTRPASVIDQATA